MEVFAVRPKRLHRLEVVLRIPKLLQQFKTGEMIQWVEIAADFHIHDVFKLFCQICQIINYSSLAFFFSKILVSADLID